MRLGTGGNFRHGEFHMLVASGIPLQLDFLSTVAREDGTTIHIPSVGVIGGVACTLANCDGVVNFGSAHANFFCRNK